jgi:hypothetical protein
MRLVYSAKDWQDNLQSTLPGYRERIVHVYLKPNEGGLNLNMDQPTIDALIGYGREAGEKLCNEFDFEEHRWRRFLVAMARMEETLDEVTKAYDQVPGQFGEFLKEFERDYVPYKQPPPPPHPETTAYRQDTKERVDEMLGRAQQLADLGKKWGTTIRRGTIPSPPTHLRITPKY